MGPANRSVLGPVAFLDARLGDGIEWAVRAKHRRRLTANGWSQALDPDPGKSRAPALREGCQLDLLVDGADCFAAMAEAIQGARESIEVAGWFITPGFEMLRGVPGRSIGALLADAAERVEVRVLLWAGSPVPLFQPNRRQAKATQAALTDGTRVRCELDVHERALHCHHEKTLIVDGQVAFIGGIDMTDLKNDRFDTSEHPARMRVGWHDVAARVTGPVVADVATHFAMRWQEVTGETLGRAPAPEATGDHAVGLTRTVPERQYAALPGGDFSVLESYVRAIRGATELIYIENQFLWSPEITDLLADKLRHPPGPGFRVVIMLPTKAHAGQDDTMGQLGLLEAADVHDRLTVATLRSLTGERAGDLYIHSKLAVIDDAWMTVGSANLNAHSLFNDSEVNLVSDHPGLARDTRLTLWAEHLDVDRSAITDRPVAAVVDELWRPITRKQLSRQEAGRAPTHRLVGVRGAARRSERLLGPLSGLLDDA